MQRWNEKYHDKFKRHSLSGQLREIPFLNKAWMRVKENRGCPGIDNEDISQFENQLDLRLLEIQRLLREKRYEPEPVKRVFIPKPDGRQRPLGIPTVRDRVVQQGLRMLLEPVFEESFLPCSHGYRPGKNAHQAITKASAYIEHGYCWVVDADIDGFFDHVDHTILLDLVNEKVSDGSILRLIESFLKSGVMNGGEFIESVEGTPQGGVISPLLANIYLNHFDRRMGELGFILDRYADDFLIFCKTEEEAIRALDSARGILWNELRLSLSATKTRIVHCSEGFDFLGYHFQKGGKGPKESAIRKFKDNVRFRTRRNQPKKLQQVIGELNPLIRGWGSYFSLSKWKTQFSKLDHWIRTRLRCFKAKHRDRHVIYYVLPGNALEKMGLTTLRSCLSR
jgi:group II intron reverse transcriptase/maturase